MFDTAKAKALLNEVIDGKPKTGGIVACMDESGLAQTVAGGDGTAVLVCVAIAVRDIALANNVSDKKMLHYISQLLRQIDQVKERQAEEERKQKQEAMKQAMGK